MSNPTPKKPYGNKPKTARELWSEFVVWSVICTCCGWFFYSCATRTSTPSQSGITLVACKNYGRTLANYPDTAEFGFGELTDGDRRWESTMTAKNGFGVPSTSSFVCWADSSGRVTSFDIR